MQERVQCSDTCNYNFFKILLNCWFDMHRTIGYNTFVDVYKYMLKKGMKEIGEMSA